MTDDKLASVEEANNYIWVHILNHGTLPPFHLLDAEAAERICERINTAYAARVRPLVEALEKISHSIIQKDAEIAEKALAAHREGRQGCPSCGSTEHTGCFEGGEAAHRGKR